MKRTPLKRGSKPLKSNQGLSRGTARIKPVSPKKAGRNEKYKKAKEEYIEELRVRQGLPKGAVPYCERCKERAGSDLHHKASRNGSLLWDKRYFAWLCGGIGGCHHHIHHVDPKQARLDGFFVTPKAYE